MSEKLSAEKLMSQAPATMEYYLREAVRMIDKQFGEEGYAKAHPELVGSFLVGCATDYQATFIANEFVALNKILSGHLGDLIEELGNRS